MDQPKPKHGGMLEVEDEDARTQRIQTSMEKLNETGKNVQNNIRPIFPSRPLDVDRDLTLDPGRSTDLLSRVQAFLPQIEASNALLAQRVQADPKSVDIEHLEDGLNQYIQMNLGLGVFEQKSQVEGQHAASEPVDFTMESCTSESDSDSDADTDSSSEIITSFNAIFRRPIKPLPRRKVSGDPQQHQRPSIVVLDPQKD